MQSKQRTSKRNLKSFVVEPFKQFRIGVWAIGLSVLFVIVATLFIIAAFQDQYAQVLEMFQVVDPDKKWEFLWNDVFTKNFTRLMILFVTYIISLGVVVLMATHKVYGPLVSIERFIGDLESGHYSKRLKLREKDDLKRLAGKLNKLAESLDKKHSEK